MKRPKPKPRTPAKKSAAPDLPEAPAITVHHLKAWRDTFEPIYAGTRTFDIRLDDRRFKTGELVEFHEWNERDKAATGRKIRKTITIVVHGLAESACHPLSQPRWGIKGGYVIMAFQ